MGRTRHQQQKPLKSRNLSKVGLTHASEAVDFESLDSALGTRIMYYVSLATLGCSCSFC